MGFIRLMVAVIFIMWFGSWNHQNVAVFLEYLRMLRRKGEPCLYGIYITLGVTPPPAPNGKGLLCPWAGGNHKAGRGRATS